MSTADKSGRSQETSTTSEGGFSQEERAAMKERAAELKAESRGGKGAKKAAADEAAVLSKIEGMEPADRALAERLHLTVTAACPDLAPKLWYGQPAYAKGGKVVCFFRSGHDDKERYATFGFTTAAKLDDGGMWPTSFAVSALDDADVARITELVERAVG